MEDIRGGVRETLRSGSSLPMLNVHPRARSRSGVDGRRGSAFDIAYWTSAKEPEGRQLV